MKRIYRILKKDITLILKITRVKECSHNKESLMSRNSNIDSKHLLTRGIVKKKRQVSWLTHFYRPSRFTTVDPDG